MAAACTERHSERPFSQGEKEGMRGGVCRKLAQGGWDKPNEPARRRGHLQIRERALKRTLIQASQSPVLTTSLYFVVFGAAIGKRMPASTASPTAPSSCPA